MKSDQIVQLIRESSELLNQDFDGLAMNQIQSTPRSYDFEDKAEFIRDLVEEANKQRIIYLENSLDLDEFKEFIREVSIPIVAFEDAHDELVPVIFYKDKREHKVIHVRESTSLTETWSDDSFPNLHLEKGKVIFLGVFSYKSLVSDDTEDGEQKQN